MPANAQQKNYAITDAERQLVVDGNIQGFWESRLAAGDPVARAILGGTISKLTGGKFANGAGAAAFAAILSEGGTIQIFKQATMPGHQQHTGLFGRTLTGQQNLVQTIHHEYMHYTGVPTHGSIPGAFAWQRWGRKEGAALSPVFDR